MVASQILPPFDPSPSFRIAQPPNPSWSIGDKLENDTLGAVWKEGEKQGWTIIDAEKESSRSLYKLMISAIVPRPIGFVSTVSEDNIHNLAPFSLFNMVCADPPLVFFSFQNTSTRPRDTAVNIRATKEFSVNIISEPFAQNANFTSINTPAGQSEWSGSGLTMAPSTLIRPPRVKESAFSMECVLFDVLDIRSPGEDAIKQHVIFGLIKKVHIRNDVLTSRGTVDPGLLRPISRLGDGAYARLGEGFRFPAFNWEEVRDTVRELEKEDV